MFCEPIAQGLGAIGFVGEEAARRSGDGKQVAGIAILLADIGRPLIPARWELVLLDRRLFLLGIALLGCRHDGRVDDLSAHREEAAIAQCRIEADKGFVDYPGLHQPLTEQPYRGRIGHPAIEPEPQEPLGRQSVLDLELCGFVESRVERLQRQDLEHYDRIER